MQYRITVNGDEIGELNQVDGSETINPFGDRFVTEHIDSEGEKFNQVSVNDPVEIFAREPTPSGEDNEEWESIFEGYLVEDRELQEDNRDKLELWVYSFDQLIRNETVSNDQSGTRVFDALGDIVTEDTPVAWNPSKVSVGDNRRITRSLRGETVDEALEMLSRKSENESFGVDEEREFFFRRREESAGERDVTDSDVIDWDIPERGKESKNRVTVWYDNGDESVDVEVGGEQKRIQEGLDTEGGVGFPDEISRPEIIDRQEALAEGRRFIRQREETIAGEVTVVDEPGFVLGNDIGDIIDVEITPQGVDDEFVIVSKEVDYTAASVTYGIVEKRGNQDSLLREIGRQVKRNELQDSDRDQPSDIVTQTKVRAEISVDPAGGTPSLQKGVLTTTGKNKLRDAWGGDSPPEISSVEVAGGSDISRSDTDIDASDSESATVNQSGNVVTVTADFTDLDGERIIGLVDTAGDLIVVALLESGLSGSETVGLELTVEDSSPANHVLTETGQQTLAELLDGDDSNIPAKVGYGSDDTEVSESDTSLADEIVIGPFDDTPVVDVDSTFEWEDFAPEFDDDEPITVGDNELRTQRIAYFTEVEVVSGSGESDPFQADEYSGGEARGLNDLEDHEIVWEVTPEYDIPAEYVAIQARDTDGRESDTWGSDGLVEFDWSFDGNVFERNGNEGAGIGIGWTKLDGFYQSPAPGPITEEDLEAGETYTIRCDPTSDGGTDYWYVVDCICLYDERYEDQIDFDNTPHEPEGYLDGPQLYPEAFDVDFGRINIPQQFIEANLSSDWRSLNVDNEQSITLASDADSVTENNSTTATLTLSEADAILELEITLSRFTGSQNQTPRTGNEYQAIESLNIDLDVDGFNISDVGRVDVERIFVHSDVENETIAESAQLTDDEVALTRSVFPEIEPNNQDVIFSEDLGTNID